jgi:hypothetical protein
VVKSNATVSNAPVSNDATGEESLCLPFIRYASLDLDA